MSLLFKSDYLKLHMNANIMKTQVFHKIIHDFKGHSK